MDNAMMELDISALTKDVEGYMKGDLVMERARDLLARSDFHFKDKIKNRMKGSFFVFFTSIFIRSVSYCFHFR